jgi:hypothetical protein
MTTDDAADGHSDRFLVPNGSPHLAPVIEPSGGEAMREFAWLLLSARDRADQNAQDHVSNWLSTHRGESVELLQGLTWMAAATMRDMYESSAREELAKIAAARSESWQVATTQLDSETLEGYLAATELVNDDLRSDTTSFYELFDRLIRTPTSTRGAIFGTADLIIEAARNTRGSAQEWIALLRYMNTGQGKPTGSLGVPHPTTDLTGELAADLGGPDTDPPATTPSPLLWTAQDCFAGAQLVTSYLCYRDAGATVSEHRIRDWLRDHPASICGFLVGLTNLAYTLLTAEAGDREAALRTTSHITNVMANMHPRTEPDEIQSAPEGTEGFRSAAAMLTHRIHEDQDAQNLLLHRILQTWSLSWGAIQGLTTIAVATLESFDDPTELLHDLHSYASAITT